jgi:hypothetical protein
LGAFNVVGCSLLEQAGGRAELNFAPQVKAVSALRIIKIVLFDDGGPWRGFAGNAEAILEVDTLTVGGGVELSPGNAGKKDEARGSAKPTSVHFSSQKGSYRENNVFWKSILAHLAKAKGNAPAKGTIFLNHPPGVGVIYNSEVQPSGWIARCSPRSLP